jgi:ureidoglycolate lyase
MMAVANDSPERPINYLEPEVPPALPWHELPLIRATPVSLAGYGELVDDPANFPVEIVTWPALGWRPVDPGTGNEGGTTAGNFDVWWDGEVLFGRNEAVNDQYLLGWSRNPGELSAPGRSDTPPERSRVLLWHANYHPDGGQLFSSVDGGPFIVPLSLPGDDIAPGDFVAFFVEAGRGLYIHPRVWHEAVFPLSEKSRFFTKQGKVHARISCHIAQEFGVFLSIPLREPRP